MASVRDRGGHVQMLLGAYILGGLSAREAAVVRAHLDRCPLCRAEHDELACVPSWLDLLAGTDVAGGLTLVADDRVEDRDPGEDCTSGED